MVACALVRNHQRWIIAVILIAFTLRLLNLTYHSFWFDEAVSVYWARQSIPRILEVGFLLVEDRLPPLYYLTLKGWGGLAGLSEFAIRLLSVFYGVLLVPVIFSIAALLFKRRVGMMAAALVAVNPFLVWYSQEARMYAPAVFFGMLAVWAFLRICKSANQRLIRNTFHIILFITSATAALYSHLYAGFLLPALGLWLLISYPRRRKLWLIFAVSGLIITVAYAPILPAIWRFSAESSPGNPLSGVLRRAWDLTQAFTVWKASLWPILQSGVPALTLLFAALAFLPAPPPTPAGQPATLPRPHLLMALLTIVPFLIANLLLARNHLAFFGERYFIVITPWLLLLAVLGADNIGLRLTNLKTSRPANAPSSFIIHHSAFVFLLLLSAIPLPGQWSTGAAKEAWRQSVAYLAQHAAPEDGILIHPDWVRYPFQFYFQGPEQTYAAFSNVTAKTALDGPMQGVVGGHKVIWLVQSHVAGPDPERRVERWLAQRYPLVTELYPPGISLKAFAPGYQQDTLPPEATPAELQFENGMRLAGFQVDSTAPATDALFHPPSGWIHVTLYWRTGRPVGEDAIPFVNLVGPAGVWGASLNRPTDALKLFPPSRWGETDTIIRHDLDVNLNPATPPGRYQLVVGLPGYPPQYPLAEVEIQ